MLFSSCFLGTGCEWPTFPEKRDQGPHRLDAWFHWQVAHIRLAVRFGFDLSSIPARMTGNTKYFARMKAQLEGPTASTTARYHGPQKILNPKKISLTQLRVASQPQEGQPNLQTPQPLLSRGSGEDGTGWLSSEQPCSPSHDGHPLQPVPQQRMRRWARGRGAQGRRTVQARLSLLSSEPWGRGSPVQRSGAPLPAAVHGLGHVA